MTTDLSLKTTAASLQPTVELNAAQEQGTCVETKYQKTSAQLWELCYKACMGRYLDFSTLEEDQDLYHSSG